MLKGLFFRCVLAETLYHPDHDWLILDLINLLEWYPQMLNHLPPAWRQSAMYMKRKQLWFRSNCRNLISLLSLCWFLNRFDHHSGLPPRRTIRFECIFSSAHSMLSFWLGQYRFRNSSIDSIRIYVFTSLPCPSSHSVSAGRTFKSHNKFSLSLTESRNYNSQTIKSSVNDGIKHHEAIFKSTNSYLWYNFLSNFYEFIMVTWFVYTPIGTALTFRARGRCRNESNRMEWELMMITSGIWHHSGDRTKNKTVSQQSRAVELSRQCDSVSSNGHGMEWPEASHTERLWIETELWWW